MKTSQTKPLLKQFRLQWYITAPEQMLVNIMDVYRSQRRVVVARSAANFTAPCDFYQHQQV